MVTATITSTIAGYEVKKMVMDHERRLLYVLNTLSGHIRRINVTSGQDVILVGGGAQSTDGTLGTNFNMHPYPRGLAVDTVRNVLYFSYIPGAVQVAKMNLSTNVVNLLFTSPNANDLALDEEDNVLFVINSYFIQRYNCSSGTPMSDLIGNTNSNNCPNNGTADQCRISEGSALFFDNQKKRLFFAAGNVGNVVRYWDKMTNTVIWAAGIAGSSGQSNDGGLGTAAQIQLPENVAVDSVTNSLFIGGLADRIRMVNLTSGIIRTMTAIRNRGVSVADIATNRVYISGETEGIRMLEFKCNAGSFGLYPNCTFCNYGSYSNGLGSPQCTLCAAGNFSNQIASTNCSQCQVGTYSATLGAVSNSTCQNCPLGTFSNILGAPGLASCFNCSAGFYGSITGATSCSPCPIGMLA